MTGDSDERPVRVPHVRDALRELKRKPDEATRLLTKWFADARAAGYEAGLDEGMRRAARPPVQHRLLADIPVSSRGGALYEPLIQSGPCPTCGTCPGGATCTCPDHDCPCWMKHLKRSEHEARLLHL